MVIVGITERATDISIGKKKELYLIYAKCMHSKGRGVPNFLEVGLRHTTPKISYRRQILMREEPLQLLQG